MSEIIDCMVFIVQKTCWTCWKFVEFVGLRLLDLLGLIFNILACATVVRLPCMIRQFLEMKSMSEWRYVGLIQCLIFLMDIPVIIMGLITLVLTFGLILIPFIKKIKRKKVKCDYAHSKGGIFFGGFKLRGIVISYFVRVICDMFCVPLGVICLLSWRSCVFLRKIRKVEKWDKFEWRKTCVVQFLHLLLDIPCVICGVFLLFTWRGWWLVYTYRKLKKDGTWSWNSDRFLVFVELFCLITDVVFFAIALITLVTWRGPLVIHDLINTVVEEDDDDDDCSCHMNFEWTVKFKILKQLALVFVDIPCIICAFIVMITVWRFPRFLRKCKKDEWKLRANCVRQFLFLLVDFGFLLLNTVCAIVSLFVVVSIWRAYPLIKDLKKYLKQRSEIGRETNTSDEQIDNGDEQRPQTNEVNDQVDNNAEQRRNKKTLKKLKNANSWKMRKAVFKHFAFLFLDFPAIIACVVLLVTVVRLPKLLAKLLQAGDFYMEFALIAFMQLGKLLVDLAFLILFIVLMILRPIQSWVHLLEDEDHQKIRLLRFYMQWVPDIIEKRHQMYREMEEVFSASLKNKISSHNVRIEFSLINAQFLKDLQWIRDKIMKYELEGQYNHLLRMIQFYEGKRPYKMERLYQCELNYLHRANFTVHNENLTKYRNEMVRFESRVHSAIHDLEKFTVKKVPLWTEECGLKTRTRQETQKVLIKCLPSGRFLITILILLNLILIYRGPTLIRNLYRQWYNRRKIVFASLKEYMRDFLTLLIILLVILTVYRAPFLLLEISNDIISKRSWEAVRQTVRRYPPKFSKDLVDLVILLFSWKTVRFIFTAIVFGLLMPADLFLTVMKFLCGNLCLAGFCTIILYIFFFGFPFILSFGIAPLLLASGSASTITVIVGIFGIFLAVFLVLAAVLTFKHREDTFSVRPKAYDYVRFNWTNSHTILFEIIEFLQLMALVFVIPGIPMYGGTTLNRVSNHLLLNFASFEFKFWMTTALFVAWFFICGLPVIFEQVLETFPNGTFAKQISWTLLVSLFTNTLFVTLVESFLGFVACQSVDCPLNSGNSTNYTHCSSSILHDDIGVSCWKGSHTGIAVFGLLALVWYSTTAIVFGTRYGDSDHPSLDLKFSPIYNIMINFVKAVMVGVSVLAVARPFVAFPILLILNLTALVFTLCFRRVFGFMLSNSFLLILWRIVSFISSIVASASAIIAKAQNDSSSVVPLCIFLGGTGTVVLLAIVVSVVRVVRRALTPIEHQRKEFRTCIKQLEERLIRGNRMVNSWEKNRKRWKRLVSHVYEAQSDDDNDLTTRQLDLPEEIMPPPSSPDPRNHPNRLSVDLTRSGVRSSLYEIQSHNLPLPPSYQELFPHTMTPFDQLPPPPPYCEASNPLSESELLPNTVNPTRSTQNDGENVTERNDAHNESYKRSNEHKIPQLEMDTTKGKEHFPSLAGNVSAGSDTVEANQPLEEISERANGSEIGVALENVGENEGPVSFDSVTEALSDITKEKQPPQEVSEFITKESDVRTNHRVDESEDSTSLANKPEATCTNDDERSVNVPSTQQESQPTESGFEDVLLGSPSLAPLGMEYESENFSEKHGNFDSILFLESLFRSDEKRKREPNPVLAMECNGKNLLLVLEQHIHYSAYSFAFVTQLPMWRHSVERANWTRLLECFRTLESNLNGAFNFPSRVDVAYADLCVPLLELPPDKDKVPIPTFVPEPSDPDEIRSMSDAVRSSCLRDIATLTENGSKWVELLDRVFPTKPVFKSWVWDAGNKEFTIHFRRMVRGTITDVGPRGIKLAKGAIISIPKVLKGQFGGNEVHFRHGFEPKGSKGPVSVTVNEIGILQLNEKLYVTAQGKRLAFDKAMDCLYEIEWK